MPKKRRLFHVNTFEIDPKLGDVDIEALGEIIDDKPVYSEITCTDCDEEWLENYKPDLEHLNRLALESSYDAWDDE